MKEPSLNFDITKRYEWVVSLGTRIFFYLFLLVFLPFGVDNYNPAHEYAAEFLLEISFFMFATTFLMRLSDFFIKKIALKSHISFYELWPDNFGTIRIFRSLTRRTSI